MQLEALKAEEQVSIPSRRVGDLDEEAVVIEGSNVSIPSRRVGDFSASDNWFMTLLSFHPLKAGRRHAFTPFY